MQVAGVLPKIVPLVKIDDGSQGFGRDPRSEARHFPLELKRPRA
jgi:hypothetical protein